MFPENDKTTGRRMNHRFVAILSVLVVGACQVREFDGFVSPKRSNDGDPPMNTKTGTPEHAIVGAKKCVQNRTINSRQELDLWLSQRESIMITSSPSGTRVAIWDSFCDGLPRFSGHTPLKISPKDHPLLFIPFEDPLSICFDAPGYLSKRIEYRSLEVAPTTIHVNLVRKRN